MAGFQCFPQLDLEGIFKIAKFVPTLLQLLQLQSEEIFCLGHSFVALMEKGSFSTTSLWSHLVLWDGRLNQEIPGEQAPEVLPAEVMLCMLCTGEGTIKCSLDCIIDLLHQRSTCGCRAGPSGQVSDLVF